MGIRRQSGGKGCSQPDQIGTDELSAPPGTQLRASPPGPKALRTSTSAQMMSPVTQMMSAVTQMMSLQYVAVMV